MATDAMLMAITILLVVILTILEDIRRELRVRRTPELTVGVHLAAEQHSELARVLATRLGALEEWR